MKNILKFLMLLIIGLGACTLQYPPQEPYTATEKNTYLCQSGAIIEVSYPDLDTAILQYQDKTYYLQIAVSASGARYIGQDLEWWTKGSGPGSSGSLFTNDPDQEILESCLAQ